MHIMLFGSSSELVRACVWYLRSMLSFVVLYMIHNSVVVLFSMILLPPYTVSSYCSLSLCVVIVTLHSPSAPSSDPESPKEHLAQA